MSRTLWHLELIRAVGTRGRLRLRASAGATAAEEQVAPSCQPPVGCFGRILPLFVSLQTHDCLVGMMMCSPRVHIQFPLGFSCHDEIVSRRLVLVCLGSGAAGAPSFLCVDLS